MALAGNFFVAPAIGTFSLSIQRTRGGCTSLQALFGQLLRGGSHGQGSRAYRKLRAPVKAFFPIFTAKEPGAKSRAQRAEGKEQGAKYYKEREKFVMPRLNVSQSHNNWSVSASFSNSSLSNTSNIDASSNKDRRAMLRN